MEIEQRLLQVELDLEGVTEDLIDAEQAYVEAKKSYELAQAKARVAIYRSGEKMTVALADATIDVNTEREREELAGAEMSVKACRARAEMVRTKVSLFQSMGASVRASMSL
jgi:hypothetical protein